MALDTSALFGNLAFLDELYERYREDPGSVDASFRALFENGHGAQAPQVAGGRVTVGDLARLGATASLVDAYRTLGHLSADLDPLDMLERQEPDEMDPAHYGLSGADLDRVVPSGGLFGVDAAPLREILERLARTYCGSIGLEFMHIATPARRRWLAERMETAQGQGRVDEDTCRAMLERVVAAEVFEDFIHKRFVGTKRYSLEGSESFMALLDLVIEHGARLGAVEAVLGMAHRGRLDVLTQIMGKRPREMFAEFEDINPESVLGAGDVKYHMGYSCDHKTRRGDKIHLSLTFNPSHLEAVDPVVVGRVRAKQRRYYDTERQKGVGILVHGDAAFAGQGLVAETLQMANLHGYRTGGTVHIIINNQIGFTATPAEYRSTPYATDVAKMLECPIFHVNGEDLDAVAFVAELAMEYRREFASDVVIDLFCYRKYGHNELDEPMFTQPLLYERIQAKKPISEIYGRRLAEEGTLKEGELDRIRGHHRKFLNEEFDHSRSMKERPRIQHLGGVWQGYLGGPDHSVPEPETGVPVDLLKEIAGKVTTFPDGFSPHPKIKRLFRERAAMGAGDRPLNWGMAETLAYGTLCWEGHLVRISGEDSSRGTFSHRHAVIVDVETGEEYYPLSNLHEEQGEFRIYDSPLSEAGVLGFELGFSLDYPDGLIIWEAQFGDFVNGAQVIIDQFLSASEDKWKRLSGLTLFLPHGYEGQGPEHSSGRIERFLQSSAEDNWQVVQPSTPAQMFHLLRRQVIRKWRKPLIVFTPKSLLRLPEASSTLEELSEGKFRRVLPDPENPEADKVKRVFLCSGKIYYELADERKKRGDTESAILRIEQIYPWRDEDLDKELAAYTNKLEVVWVQEEPSNMGAYSFLEPRIRKLLGGVVFRAECREASASPATGSHKAHVIEQRALLDRAFATELS